MEEENTGKMRKCMRLSTQISLLFDLKVVTLSLSTRLNGCESDRRKRCFCYVTATIVIDDDSVLWELSNDDDWLCDHESAS